MAPSEAIQLDPDSVTDLVDRYLSGWNETDAGERRSIIEAAWEPDAQLVDPPLDGAGHDGIDSVIVALQDHYPGHRFQRTGAVDVHHDAFRVGWALQAPDGSIALAGTDFGLVGPSGRVARVTGFFDVAKEG